MLQLFGLDTALWPGGQIIQSTQHSCFNGEWGAMPASWLSHCTGFLGAGSAMPFQLRFQAEHYCPGKSKQVFPEGQGTASPLMLGGMTAVGGQCTFEAGLQVSSDTEEQDTTATRSMSRVAPCSWSPKINCSSSCAPRW